MYGFIIGRIEEIEENLVCLNCNNVGYEIYIPDSVKQKLPPTGEEIKLYTYLNVREDALVLFGFLTKEDKHLFKLLLTVSGIGPKGALSILSVMTPQELKFAILAGDDKQISKAPGVGKKMAQKLIIELKDKIDLSETLAEQVVPESEIANSARNDAISALTALGYSATESMKTVSSITITPEMDAEDIIKLALKKLAF